MVLDGDLRARPRRQNAGPEARGATTGDTGCAASCLECPFERCIGEEPGAAFRYTRTTRDARIAGLAREGKGSRQIAEETGVSQRTVQRAIKRAKVRVTRTK